MSALNIEKERSDFEVEARKITHAKNFEHEGDGYEDYVLDTYWRFWLAAKRAAQPVEAHLPPPMDSLPPGSRQCDTCEGWGVIDECVVCGSAKPHEGTCGSDDPRALCNWTPAKPAPSVPAQMADEPLDDSQEWARLDGTTAFHLIERHADDWAETGRMMEAWRIARTVALAESVPVPSGGDWLTGRIQRALDQLADAKLPSDVWRDVSNVLHACRDAIAAAWRGAGGENGVKPAETRMDTGFDPGGESIAAAGQCGEDATEAMVEAGAEVLYGSTRAQAFEWAKQDKFDSCTDQARAVYRAMRAAIAAKESK